MDAGEKAMKDMLLVPFMDNQRKRINEMMNGGVRRKVMTIKSPLNVGS